MGGKKREREGRKRIQIVWTLQSSSLAREVYSAEEKKNV